MLGFRSSREFMGIPTESEWLSHTTGLTVRHRGAELLAIDRAIGHYHQTKASQALEHGGWKAILTKMKVITLQLTSIVKACEDWLTSKTASGEIARSSRAPVILRLLQNSLDEVLVLLPEGKGFDPANPAPYLYQVASDIRWKMILPLIHNTSSHRQLHMDNAMESNPGGVNPDHFLGDHIATQFKAQNEFNFLFDFIRSKKVASDTAKILYLARDARWQHRICIEGGHVYRVKENGIPNTEKRVTGNGQLLISAENKHIYFLNREVMDAELEKRNADVAADGHHYEIRHSTFLAGEPCFFAGGLSISSVTPGKIEMIDNCSGHYRPSIKEFIAAINLLNETGTLNLDDIFLAVGMYAPSPEGKWLFNGRPICSAKIAVDDFSEFEKIINQKQKVLFEQGLEEGMALSGELLNNAMTLGVSNLTLETYLDSMGMSEMQKNESLKEKRSKVQIRTDINFF